MVVLILGDTHGEWYALNEVVQFAFKHHVIDLIIQVGDFGYGWPESRPGKDPVTYSTHRYHKRYNTKEEREQYLEVPHLWLDGNHENHELIAQDQGATQPNWTYMPRGSVYEHMGKRFMFFGGATSIDKKTRTPGVSWWPEESITMGQVMKTLEEEDGPIDYMFSHEHPDIVPFKDKRADDSIGKADRVMLDQLRVKYKPKAWFYGHHHIPRYDCYDGAEYRCCGEVGRRYPLTYHILDPIDDEVQMIEVPTNKAWRL